MSSTLILGGVRSGKSRFAQSLAERSGLPVVYLATAKPGDDAEMRSRIARHRAERPPAWRTVEEPLALSRTLESLAQPGRFVIVDCLTLWLTNQLLQGEQADVSAEVEHLCELLPALHGDVVLISNEVGLGVVPATPLSRRFCDTAGALHQRLGAICERVVFMVAGLPQYLRGGEDANGR